MIKKTRNGLILVIVLAYLFSISLTYPEIFPKLQVTTVWAESGHFSDIQAAVDEVASHGGGNVFIPEGEWVFANSGDNAFEYGDGYETAVHIPAGVSLFGAPTDRGTITYNGETMTDMPLEWKTVLKMGYDVASNILVYGGIPCFFHFSGNGLETSTPTRFSDIKIVGWRYDHQSSNQLRHVTCDGVIDMRVDHCFFQDMCAGGWMGGSANQDFRGVIDHCIHVNSYGVPEPYDTRTVGYGWGVSAGGTDIWESDITKVQGHYGWMTVFVEDCYFEKWRHSVCGGHGAHYVFRHSVIKDDYGFGSLDAHGTYQYVGTRAIEVYENKFLDPIWTGHAVCFHRGGAGVYVNNTVRNNGVGYYYSLVSLACEGVSPIVGELDDPQDIYVWDNVAAVAELLTVAAGYRTEGVHYFFNAMPGWTPYPHPHYLVSGEDPPEPTEPMPEPPPPAEDEYGSISGVVTNNLTSVRLQGVTVSCGGLSDVTDSDGEYVLADVPTGSQSVRFSLTGYWSANKSVTIVADQTVTLNCRLTPTTEPEPEPEPEEPTEPEPSQEQKFPVLLVAETVVFAGAGVAVWRFSKKKR